MVDKVAHGIEKSYRLARHFSCSGYGLYADAAPQFSSSLIEPEEIEKRLSGLGADVKRMEDPK
ncbi:MAG TPA: hypothetical protein VNT79_17765 [Phycisphaerae bacterium]|nr:hypothetical protein [Phycisphaerae bacterium]